MAFRYDHPRPALTVDAVVLGREGGRVRVLLVRRGKPPFEGAWALPGGFVDENEPLGAAAVRELEEETGVRDVVLEQLHAFGDPGRDPRGWTVSIAHVGVLDAPLPEPRGADDAAEARWHDVESLPDLAFDHADILRMALARRG